MFSNNIKRCASSCKNKFQRHTDVLKTESLIFARGALSSSDIQSHFRNDSRRTQCFIFVNYYCFNEADNQCWTHRHRNRFDSECKYAEIKGKWVGESLLVSADGLASGPCGGVSCSARRLTAENNNNKKKLSFAPLSYVQQH